MQISIPRSNPALSLLIAITGSLSRLSTHCVVFFSSMVQSFVAGLIRTNTSTLSIDEKRKIALATLEACGGKHYSILYYVESTPHEEFSVASTARTVLDPLVDGLRRAGIRTERTIGGIMRELDITQEELHVLCWCHRRESYMEAREAARILSSTFGDAGKKSTASATAQ